MWNQDLGKRVCILFYAVLVVGWDDVYLPQGIPHIYTASFSPSQCHLYLHRPPPEVQSISVMPVSLYATCWLPSAILGGGGGGGGGGCGGEKWIFSPQRPPSSTLSSPNHGLQVHLSLHSIGMSRCFSDYAWVQSADRLTICIYRERLR